ncbi:hypothetical protein ACQ4PT_046133 [Festuca glaucescens]
MGDEMGVLHDTDVPEDQPIPPEASIRQEDLAGDDEEENIHADEDDDQGRRVVLKRKNQSHLFNRSSPMKLVRVCKGMTPDQHSSDVPYHLNVDATCLVLKMFSIHDGVHPNVSTVEKELGPTYPADDAYLRKFVIYLISSVFAPTTRIKVSPKCYPSVVNTEAISCLNWAKFIVDILCQTASEKDKKNWFKACMPYIMILYVDSLETNDVHVPEDGTRCSIWTNKMIHTVASLDTHSDGSFGALPDLMKYRHAIINMYTVFEDGLATFIRSLGDKKETATKPVPKEVDCIRKLKIKRTTRVPTMPVLGGKHQEEQHEDKLPKMDFDPVVATSTDFDQVAATSTGYEGAGTEDAGRNVVVDNFKKRKSVGNDSVGDRVDDNLLHDVVCFEEPQVGTVLLHSTDEEHQETTKVAQCTEPASVSGTLDATPNELNQLQQLYGSASQPMAGTPQKEALESDKSCSRSALKGTSSIAKKKMTVTFAE